MRRPMKGSRSPDADLLTSCSKKETARGVQYLRGKMIPRKRLTPFMLLALFMPKRHRRHI
jgi:hypothetical protein